MANATVSYCVTPNSSLDSNRDAPAAREQAEREARDGERESLPQHEADEPVRASRRAPRARRFRGGAP